MKNDNIEFKDFSQAITTEEFIAVLEVITGVNEQFNKALISREKKGVRSSKNLDKLEKEYGKYSQTLMDARKVHKGLERVTNEDIATGFSLFLQNYEGIIEFLTRFNEVGSIKKHDISPFVKKKDHHRTGE